MIPRIRLVWWHWLWFYTGLSRCLFFFLPGWKLPGYAAILLDSFSFPQHPLRPPPPPPTIPHHLTFPLLLFRHYFLLLCLRLFQLFACLRALSSHSEITQLNMASCVLLHYFLVPEDITQGCHSPVKTSNKQTNKQTTTTATSQKHPPNKQTTTTKHCLSQHCLLRRAWVAFPKSGEVTAKRFRNSAVVNALLPRKLLKCATLIQTSARAT